MKSVPSAYFTSPFTGFQHIYDVLMLCLEGRRRRGYLIFGLQIDDKIVYLDLPARCLFVLHLS